MSRVKSDPIGGAGKGNKIPSEVQEQDRMGKHPLSDHGFGNGGGGTSAPPPSFGLNASGGDEDGMGLGLAFGGGGEKIGGPRNNGGFNGPILINNEGNAGNGKLEGVADDLFFHIQKLWDLKTKDTKKLLQLIQNLDPKDLPLLQNVYIGKYEKGLHSDLQAVLKRYRHYHILYPITKLFVGEAANSDGDQEDKTNSRPRSESDLLPGKDEVRESDYEDERVKSALYPNISGEFLIVGQKTEFIYESNLSRNGLSHDAKQITQPFVSSAILYDSKGKFKAVNFSKKVAFGKFSFSFSPEHSGNYRLMAWIKYPDRHIEVLQRKFMVKEAKEVSNLALENVKTGSLGEFENGMIKQELSLSKGSTQNQEGKKGESFISTNTSNPYCPIYSNAEQISNSTFQAKGFSPKARIKWFVKLKTSEQLKFGKFGNLSLAASHLAKRYHCQKGEFIYELGTGPTAQFKPYLPGVCEVIAEEVDEHGAPKGNQAIYRLAVLSSEEKDKYDKLKTHQEVMDEQIGKIKKGASVPIKAAYTAKEGGSSMALALYIGPSSTEENQACLIDLTPGTNKREFHGQDANGCLQAFNNGNTYPSGHISLEIPANEQNIDPGSWNCATDGSSMLQKISSGSFWASMGMAAGGAVAAASPVPGGRVLASYLFMGATGMGISGGIASLADRSSDAEQSWMGVAIDVVGLAASFMNAGVLLKAAKANPASLLTTKSGQFLIYGSYGLESSEVLLISIDSAMQIAQINDSELDRDAKIKAIVAVIGQLSVTGGMHYISKQDLKEMRTAKPEQKKSRQQRRNEQRKLEKEGNKKKDTIDDLDQATKSQGDISSEEKPVKNKSELKRENKSKEREALKKRLGSETYQKLSAKLKAELILLKPHAIMSHRAMKVEIIGQVRYDQYKMVYEQYTNRIELESTSLIEMRLRVENVYKSLNSRAKLYKSKQAEILLLKEKIGNEGFGRMSDRTLKEMLKLSTNDWKKIKTINTHDAMVKPGIIAGTMKSRYKDIWKQFAVESTMNGLKVEQMRIQLEVMLEKLDFRIRLYKNLGEKAYKEGKIHESNLVTGEYDFQIDSINNPTLRSSSKKKSKKQLDDQVRKEARKKLSGDSRPIVERPEEGPILEFDFIDKSKKGINGKLNATSGLSPKKFMKKEADRHQKVEGKAAGEDFEQEFNSLADDRVGEQSKQKNDIAFFDVQDSAKFHDSERKWVEDVMRKLEQKISDLLKIQYKNNHGYTFRNKEVHNGISGTLKISSEMSPCPSCAQLLNKQIQKRFNGKVKVEVQYGVKYYDGGNPDYHSVHKLLNPQPDGKREVRKPKKGPSGK